MSQIKVKILKQGTPSDKVLSFAFFTMKSAYRSFNKYEHQLKQSIHDSRVLKGFETRIYTDDTGADIAISIAEKYSDVSVYHFDCPLFREGEGHVGTFGTLVRFLPMFEDGLSTVWISDIDVGYHADWFSNSLLKLVSKYDVFAENRICYERRPWNVGRKYPFVAHRMIFNVIFPRRMLTHYINKLADGSYADEIALINEYNISSSRPKSRNDRFPYGMDEYFLNVVLYEYIKRKDMRCLFRKDYEMGGWLTSSHSNLTEKEKKSVRTYHDNKNKPGTLPPHIKQLYKKGIQHFQQLDPMRFKCFDEVSELLDTFKGDMTAWFSVSGKDI